MTMTPQQLRGGAQCPKRRTPSEARATSEGARPARRKSGPLRGLNRADAKRNQAFGWPFLLEAHAGAISSHPNVDTSNAGLVPRAPANVHLQKPGKKQGSARRRASGERASTVCSYAYARSLEPFGPRKRDRRPAMLPNLPRMICSWRLGDQLSKNRRAASRCQRPTTEIASSASSVRSSSCKPYWMRELGGGSRAVPWRSTPWTPSSRMRSATASSSTSPAMTPIAASVAVICRPAWRNADSMRAKSCGVSASTATVTSIRGATARV